MKQIPNAITCLNLIAGCLAVIFAFQGELTYSSIFIFCALIFDFLDGAVARLLKAYSELGKQLDSLADAVSFGVAPGMMLFILLTDLNGADSWIPYCSLLIPVFSVIRLAKFNIDPRQSENFIGLPTPSTAIVIASLPFIKENPDLSAYFIQNVSLILLIIILSAVMVSEIPLFSLKLKNFNWAQNKFRFLLIFLALPLLIFLKFAALPVIIMTYIILSLVKNQTNKARI